MMQDHPRRCGENTLSQTDSVWDIGSPPQVRGKRFSRAYRAIRDRITPAGAGKTIVLQFRQQTFRDHPRGCGENALPTEAQEQAAGSPPRMRGKLSAAFTTENGL